MEDEVLIPHKVLMALVLTRNDFRESLIELLSIIEDAIKSGDWKVDGACDPDMAIQRAKKTLKVKLNENT